MPAIEPGKIRNVAVVGHRGTGKTALVEALLYQAGETNRLGTIDAGSTVSDWDDDEQRRMMSISLSLTHAEWQDRKLNLIDVPGDPSFQGEARCSLRVVEGGEVSAEPGGKTAEPAFLTAAGELLEQLSRTGDVTHRHAYMGLDGAKVVRRRVHVDARRSRPRTVEESPCAVEVVLERVNVCVSEVELDLICEIVRVCDRPSFGDRRRRPLGVPDIAQSDRPSGQRVRVIEARGDPRCHFDPFARALLDRGRVAVEPGDHDALVHMPRDRAHLVPRLLEQLGLCSGRGAKRFQGSRTGAVFDARAERREGRGE